jgi:hypothetical protein
MIAVVALALSSLAFAGALYWTSAWNWAPVEIPLPGPGLAVEEPFDIATPGTFRFEASVPISRPTSAMEDLPLVACHLEVSVTRDGSEAKHLLLKTFRAGGRSSTQIYTEEQAKVELGAGSYNVSVRNVGSSQPFDDRGALLRFTRFVYPTEYYIRGLLFRGLGWGGLVVGIVFTVFSEIRMHNRAA